VFPKELREFSPLGVLALRGGARILGFSRLRVNKMIQSIAQQVFKPVNEKLLDQPNKIIVC
jgi:hypothetical protein